MSERPSPPSSSYLEPPRQSVELEDPGAPDHTVSDSDEEHFSDASEGNSRSRSRPTSRASPVPRTRVEKVDDVPSHGDVPGTSAYEKREQDAVPDEVEVISRSRSPSAAGQRRRSVTPGGTRIPRTVVEKVDPGQPSYGDVPGTEAYEKRRADAVPDMVTKTSKSTTPSGSPTESAEANSTTTPVPGTLLSEVDDTPDDGTLHSGPHAHRRRPSDTLPDAKETVSDSPDLAPQSNSPTHPTHTRRKSTLTGGEPPEITGGDDFDDFEEGGDDDFGDFDEFDDGFQEPDTVLDEPRPVSLQPPQQTAPPYVPLLDFESIQSVSDLLTILDEPLDRLFPASKAALSGQSDLQPISNSSAIFSTERSLSLWSQLVAPPPLQPQNWVKSRIRRLFLVSLGVPVDLDEILPASKQNKLILPSINIGASNSAATGTLSRSQSLARKDSQSGPNSPRTSSTATQQRLSRRREPSPPELDLTAVRRLCTTTDAALDGLTDMELQTHVKELEQATLRASTVLEFWLKRRDGLVSEKEAFEGVIENLVNHARRVRK
ncbi:DUF5102 domain-containing protein [Aspergillus mulundensis]|uniref:Uncharacterized protein n=1 Tax=Aspergillus mulundensis TaxID=1810919 RepID=A0A3D8Q8A5_9EURO|nr:Uncharacterized protein DSM5745_11476 [Aspergillus mulundensis]XP_026598069.1 Uncharacterized protein DSM5745_11280 [Aspergillus mulundensis]RDW57581.1 Uncharacterized protein DSM5745_11476 [Aspergillus mulundensis]RDW57900.1 Uncharacterized protein DSM5745_11280 [Aspergillus mulundensis]